MSSNFKPNYAADDIVRQDNQFTQIQQVLYYRSYNLFRNRFLLLFWTSITLCKWKRCLTIHSMNHSDYDHYLCRISPIYSFQSETLFNKNFIIKKSKFSFNKKSLFNLRWFWNHQPYLLAESTILLGNNFRFLGDNKTIYLNVARYPNDDLRIL